MYLEQKTNDLSDQKKGYIKKILSNKSLDFIKENFDYTVSMFDKREQENLQDLTEQAKTQSVSHKVDRIVEEKVQQSHETPVNETANVYLSELKKY